MPVGAMARVEAKIRGPGISPRSTARLTSTSAYMAPSVSRSRIAVKPWSSAIRAFRAARMARYGVDSYSSCSLYDWAVGSPCNRRWGMRAPREGEANLPMSAALSSRLDFPGRRYAMTTTATAPPPEHKVSAQEAREVAEAAREKEWTAPSFVRDLFLGRFRLDL